MPVARRFTWLWALVMALALAWPFWPARAGADEGAADGTSPASPGRGRNLEAVPRDVRTAETLALELGPLPADFRRIDRGQVAFEFPSSVRSRIEPLVEEAESFRAHLSKDLGQSVLGSVLVRVARGPDQMAALAPQGEPPFEYASGMAYPSQHGPHLVLLSMQAPVSWEATDLAEILEHELAHLALRDAVGDHHVPLWFNEGFAMYESGEQRWPRWETLSTAAFADRLIPLAELDSAFPRETSGVSLAYAESADVIRFLARDADRARFGSLLQRVRAGVPFNRAIEDAYGTDVRKLEYEWREEVRRHLRLLPLLTGGGVFGALGAGLLVAAWIRRRRHARAKLAEWAREEAEAEVTLAAARSPRAQIASEPGIGEGGTPAVPSMPVVEHEGRWYTLH